MQTKEQAVKKCDEMIKNLGIIKECERLYLSGGIDPEEFADDYVLPKVLLYTALKNCAESMAINKDMRKQINNLRYF